MAEIKDVIRDFVNFDIENDYYQEDKKEELVRMFKEMLFEDETTVRQFLKSLFEDSKTLANQYSLVAPEGEAIEEPVTGFEQEETEEIEDAVEEVEDAEELEDAEEMEDAEEVEDSVEESVKSFYRSTASNILY